MNHTFCPFYIREAVSLDYVVKKFTPRTALDHPCHSLIAAVDDVPFGYCQWYLHRDFPDYGVALLGRPLGVSIDYFIGSPTHLWRGLWAAMRGAWVASAKPQLAGEDRVFHIGHDERKGRAIKCTIAAGFKSVANLSTRAPSAHSSRKMKRQLVANSSGITPTILAVRPCGASRLTLAAQR